MIKPSQGTKYITKTFSNIAQEVIEITSDRLKLILQEYSTCIESKKSWELPGTLFITLFITIITVDFKTVFGFDKSVWQATFLVGTILSFLWFVNTVWRALTKPSMTIDHVIKKAKEPS